MKKLFSFVCDIAVTVGCVLGVGLLSGKESQIFVGNIANIALFVAVFAISNVIFRLFCKNCNCNNLNALSQSCFKKRFGVFCVLLLVCCFVCVTTMLAGVEQCVAQIAPIANFPFYAILTAAIAALILIKGMSALKAVNVISVCMALTLIVIILSKPKSDACNVTCVPLYMPMCYAMFSATMSLGIICKLACECSVKQNVVRSVISAGILGVVILLILLSCDFTLDLPALGELTQWEKGFAAITLILCASTGIVANAYPILESVSDVIQDKTLASIAIFSFALVLSLFGFDFALKFGYGAVSVVGVIIMITVVIKRHKKVVTINKVEAK